MARIKEIVFDCADAPKLARFWAAVLDGYAVRAYDDAEIARLAALGFTPDADPTVLVDGPGPSLCFQKVDATKAIKNRVHLDVVGEPRAREVARIIALGGRLREDHDLFTVMLDPEGNEFCVQEPPR